MDTIILGGDARMPALAALLQRGGEDAWYTEDAQAARALLPSARRVVTHNPPKIEMSLDDILAWAGDDAEICLCGPKIYDGNDGRVVDLWTDEALLIENARLTAEGAVAAAMRAARRCIRGLNCAVIGWGRVGGALAELLVAMGARVTVISRTEAHRSRAIERGAEAAGYDALPEVLSNVRLIFSTPPAMVLDEERLLHVHHEAMIVDLASPPYGVDLAAAWKLGLRAWREPGLPGRCCPESAALALLDAMQRGRDRHD